MGSRWSRRAASTSAVSIVPEGRTARAATVSENLSQKLSARRTGCGQLAVTAFTAFSASQSHSACPTGHPGVVQSVIDHPPLRFAAMVVVNDLWRGVGGAGRGGLILCLWDEEFGE